MAGIPLVSSTPAFSEASQIIGTLNSVINSINAVDSPTGGGSLSGAITIPAVSSPVNLLSITAGATGSPVVLAPGGPSAGTSVDLILDGNAPGGVVGIGGIGTVKAGAAVQVPFASSVVNGITLTGAATSVAPILGVFGSDVSLDLLIQAKSTSGIIGIGGSGTTNAGAGLQVASVASQVNGLQILAAATSVNPQLVAFGSDTNLNIQLTPKGSGLLRFGNTASFAANGTVAATFTTTSAPSGARTSIQKWLQVSDATNATFFIALF